MPSKKAMNQIECNHKLFRLTSTIDHAYKGRSIFNCAIIRVAQPRDTTILLDRRMNVNYFRRMR